MAALFSMYSLYVQPDLEGCALSRMLFLSAFYFVVEPGHSMVLHPGLLLDCY